MSIDSIFTLAIGAVLIPCVAVAVEVEAIVAAEAKIITK